MTSLLQSGWFMALSASCLFSVGSVFIARFSRELGDYNLLIAILALTVANSCYVEMLRSISLGYAAIITSACGLAFTFAASYWLLNEDIGTRQILALVLAITAVVLYSLPMSSEGVQ